MNVTGKNPYVGPRTFRRDESYLFFGRDREAGDLLALVVSERLVLFYAQSGAGKSSLINTQLIPSLEDNEYKVLSVGRISGASGGPKMENETQNIYIKNLMRSLIQHETESRSLADLSLSQFLAGLNEDNDGYYYDDRILTEMQRGQEPIRSRRALIIDQFEEIFSTHPETWEQREDFFAQLAQAMNADPYLWVVLVMREDYIAALDPYAHLLPGGLRVRYYMQRLGWDAALKAVKGPVENLRPYAPGVAEKLVENLASVKVRQPDGGLDVQPGQYVEPVQLQVVCFSLWERLSSENPQITEEDVRQVGNVNESLEKFYDGRVSAVAKDKNIEEREIREWFNNELITTGGIRNLVLQGQSKLSGGLDDAVIQALQGDLVRAEMRAGQIWYELSHDRLVEPVQSSNAKWFSANLSIFQQQAALWIKQGRPDGMLLRGKELELAELEQRRRQSESKTIPKDELDFLTACIKARDREKREKRGNLLLRILAIGMAITLIATFYFAYRTNQAQEEKIQTNATNTSQAAIYKTTQTAVGGLVLENEQKIALEKANDLAKKARISLGSYESRKLGRLLAVQAFVINKNAGMRILPTVYQALFESAGIGNDISINGPFSFGAFNPDLNTAWLMVDNRLWNLEDFQQYPLIDAGKVIQGTFRSNGEVAFITENSGSFLGDQSPYTVYVKDTKNQITGQLPLTLPESAFVATDISLSDDGNWVSLGYGLKPNSNTQATVTTGGIQLWNLQELSSAPKRLSIQDSPRVLAVAMARDGKKLAIVDDLKHLYLWTDDKLDTFSFYGINTLKVDANLDDDFINGVYLGVSGKGLQFSPDGRWLAVLTKRSIQIFNVNSDFKLQAQIRIPIYAIVTGYVFSPDGNYLIFSANDYSDCRDFYYKYLGSHEYLSYSDYYIDSDYYGCSPATVVNRGPLIDPNPRLSNLFPNNTLGITAMNINNSGRLVIGDEAGDIRVRDVAGDPNEQSIVTNAHDGRVTNILIGPDNKMILSAGQNDGTRLWKIPEGEQTAIRSEPTFNTTSQVIRSNGQNQDLIIIGGSDTANKKVAIQIYSNLQDPSALAVSRFDSVEDGTLDALALTEQWVVVARTYRASYYSINAAHSLDIWDRQSSAPDAKPITIPLEFAVSSMAFDPNSKLLAVATTGGGLWLDTLTDLSRWAIGATPPPDDVLASQTATATPPLFQPETQLRNALKDIRSLIFAQKGNYLIVASTSGVHLWNLGDMKENELQNAIYPVQTSGNQRWLATSSLDGSVHLYDLENITSSPAIIPNNVPVTQFAFSDDGKWLAVAINTGKVLIYDLPAISSFPVLPTHTLNGSVSDDTQLEFSPSQSEGKWLVVSAGSIVYLWNMDNPKDDPVILYGHTGTVLYGGFTQDGNQIITAAQDQTLRFWSMDPNKLADTACIYAERNLSPKEWMDYFTGQIQKTCDKYGLETEEIVVGSSPTPYPTLRPYEIPTETPTLTPTPVGDFITYTIQASDTLSGIAYKFGLDLETLIQDNSIKNRNIIVPGQILKIRVVAIPTATP